MTTRFFDGLSLDGVTTDVYEDLLRGGQTQQVDDLVALVPSSVLRPAWMWTEASREQYYHDTKVALTRVWLADMHKKGRSAGSLGNLVFRDLRPSDLGVSQDTWHRQTGTTGDTWEVTGINENTIADDTAVAIMGVNDISVHQYVTGVRVSDVGTRAEWDLFSMLTDSTDPLHRMAFAEYPVIMGANREITIEHYVRSFSPQAARGVEVKLIGLVAEKRGAVLQP